MIAYTLFLPIFTAAKDERYFKKGTYVTNIGQSGALLTWVPTLGRPLTLTYFKRKRIWQSHSSWNSSPLSTWTDICHIAFISAPPNIRLFIFSSTKYDSVICRIDERKESMRWSWMRSSSKDLNCIIKIGALNSVTKDLFLTYFTNLHWF